MMPSLRTGPEHPVCVSEVKPRANSTMTANRRLVETSLDMISPWLEFGTSPHGERAEAQMFQHPHRHISCREFSEGCKCSTFREKKDVREPAFCPDLEP